MRTKDGPQQTTSRDVFVPHSGIYVGPIAAPPDDSVLGREVLSRCQEGDALLKWSSGRLADAMTWYFFHFTTNISHTSLTRVLLLPPSCQDRGSGKLGPWPPPLELSSIFGVF